MKIRMKMKKIFYSTLAAIVLSLVLPINVKADTVFQSDIKYQKSFYSEGKKYTMYWVSSSIYSDENAWMKANNGVNEIYIVPDAIMEKYRGDQRVKMNNGNSLEFDSKGKRWWAQSSEVPKLTGIVLHELQNKGADFVGAIVRTGFAEDGKSSLSSKGVEWEIKLPDDIANEMMDLVEEKTKFRVQEGNKLDKIFWGVNIKKVSTPSLQPYTFK